MSLGGLLAGLLLSQPYLSPELVAVSPLQIAKTDGCVVTFAEGRDVNGYPVVASLRHKNGSTGIYLFFPGKSGLGVGQGQAQFSTKTFRTATDFGLDGRMLSFTRTLADDRLKQLRGVPHVQVDTLAQGGQLIPMIILQLPMFGEALDALERCRETADGRKRKGASPDQ